MTDVLEAVRAVLLADGPVSTLTQNIFEPELPTTFDLSQPSKAIVLRGGGGSERFSQGTLQIGDRTVTMSIYGETPHLASNLYTAVYLALKTLTPSVWASTYLHWAKPTMGPQNLRDPHTQWPYVLCKWQVLASDITVGP